MWAGILAFGSVPEARSAFRQDERYGTLDLRFVRDLDQQVSHADIHTRLRQ